MRIKPGVTIGKLTAQMAIGHVIVADVYARMGYECVITSGNDGQHMSGSKHLEGNALDYRTSTMNLTERARLKAMCRDALGEEFDVVLETDHLHVEYDPKAPLTDVA